VSWSDIVADESVLHKSWLIALRTLIKSTPKTVIQSVGKICVSGTSSTSVIIDCNKSLTTDDIFVTRHPRMYDYSNIQKDDANVSKKNMDLLEKWCKKDNAAFAPTSALVLTFFPSFFLIVFQMILLEYILQAKLLSWHISSNLEDSERYFPLCLYYPVIIYACEVHFFEKLHI